MKRTILLAVAAVMVGCQSQAVEKAKMETQVEKVSYSIGLDIGRNFKDQKIDVDTDAIIQGIKDGLTGAPQKMTDEECQKTMETFQSDMMNKQNASQKEAGDKNLKEGQDYLAANKVKDGVTTTASGLQYRVLAPGSGKKPGLTDTVTVHYKGTLIDGKVFDSSYTRNEPATFPVNGVIKGWQEALQLMPVGSKYMLFIPADLAYGARGAGADIGPNAVLIFEVELIAIK